jgi:hypothetical protein
MKKRVYLSGFIALICIAACLLFAKYKQFPKITPPTAEEKSQRFNYLLSHQVAAPLSSKLRPVHLFLNPDIKGNKLDGYRIGSGTALIEAGKPKLILTAAHCISEEGIYYAVTIGSDIAPSFWPLEKVVHRIDGADIVTIKVGEPKLIKKIWFENNDVKVNTKFNVALLAGEKFYGRSLITGEPFPVLGGVVMEGKTYLVMDYSPVPAESGSGFITSDGYLLVMNMYIGLDAHEQAKFGIKPREGLFSLVTSVKWPQER